MQCVYITHALSNVGIIKLKKNFRYETVYPKLFDENCFKLGLLMERFWGDAVLSQEGMDSCIRRCLIASLTSTR